MKYQEGQLVSYRQNLYWIYDIKGDKVTLVPESALDWASGVLLLEKAFQVDLSKIIPFEPASEHS